ncbi:hypothetical protein F2Q69_00001313 [Brassica cretica]|uniref:Uncharacterized protein n=1 Tax=Brassica cretica TaxID=69181 RepID=A0A8S9P0H1_BRACR|nr:hypothetical protein F2Q69_00001313 [Brassica cretica]
MAPQMPFYRYEIAKMLKRTLPQTEKRETTVRLQCPGFNSESGILEVAIVLQGSSLYVEWKRKESVKTMAPQMPFYSGILEVAIVLQGSSLYVEWKRKESVKTMAPQMPFYRYEIVKKLKRTLPKTKKRETTVRLQRLGFNSESGILEVAIVLQGSSLYVEWKRKESVKTMAPQMPFYRHEIAKKLNRTPLL